MAWIRLDDQIPRHAKIAQVPMAASWLWVCCIAHCQSQLTDGYISKTALAMIVATAGAPDIERARASGRPLEDVYASIYALVDELIIAKLLDRGPDSSVSVHDYLDLNPSKHNVLRKRREDLSRKRVDMNDSTQIPDGIRADSTQIPERSRGRAHTPAPASHPIPSHPMISKSNNKLTRKVLASTGSNGNGTHPDAADAFIGWFNEQYRTDRGVGYLVHRKRDEPVVRFLLKHFTYARLQDLARILLSEKTEDRFIQDSDRGISILKVKANWLNDRLAAWEKRNGADSLSEMREQGRHPRAVS